MQPAPENGDLAAVHLSLGQKVPWITASTASLAIEAPDAMHNGARAQQGR